MLFSVAQLRKGPQFRNQKSTPKKPRKRKEPPPQPPVSLINDKSDWNGTMFPFRGTKELYEEVSTPNDNCDFEDDEWEETNAKTDNKIKLSNALGSLMCAYNSSDDSEIEGVVPEVKTKTNVDAMPKVEATNESDNEAPLEEKIVKNTDDSLQQSLAENSSTNTKEEQVSSSRKRKRVKHRKQTSRKRTNIRKKDTGQNKDGLGVQRFRKRKATLLEKLLDSEIRHERNVLLQCVRFVVQNNFFRNGAEK